MQVSAASFGQRLTLIGNNVKLERIFNEIQKQTGYGVLVSTSKVDTEKGVKVNFRNTALTDVMDQLTKGSDLAYTIEDKVIVIKEKTPSILDRVIARFQAIDVRGKVVDTLGNGLPGATVSVKNGKGSTSTDAGGNFQLRNVDEGAVLVVSYLGYMTKEVAVSKEFNYVQLQQSASKLDEVVVNAGYYKINEKLKTGNVITISSKDIENQPSNNPILALQGRVPGLDIIQSNGLANSGVQLRIQGQTSIANGSDPLIVVDGIPYPSQTLGKIYAVGAFDGLGGIGNSPMAFINPANIAQIDILKDADATSIYGSRAANGAILITTKKGRAGKLSFITEVKRGVGVLPNSVKPTLLNTEEYLEMREEAMKNDNLSIRPTDYDLNGAWDKNRYTDWQEVLLGKNSSFTDLNTSLTAGTELFNYLVNLGYHRETTVFPGDFSNQKGSGRINLGGKTSNNKFNYNFSMSYLGDKNGIPNLSLVERALTLAPNAPALYQEDGSLNWQKLPNGTSTWENPLAILKRIYETKTVNLLGNAALNYKISPTLALSSTFGYNSFRIDEFVGSPSSSFRPERNELNSSSFSDSEIKTWIAEPQFNFDRRFGSSNISALIGVTFSVTNSSRTAISGSGYSTESLMRNISAASTISVGQSMMSQYRYTALYGRLNYNLKDTYLVNLTARRDGSSRFGSKNQFNNFGSVGVAWLFSNEPDFNTQGFFSFGKLRMSYGTIGNDQIGDYRYENLYVVGFDSVPYQGTQGLYTYGPPNASLEWVATTKLNFGLEVGILSNRLMLETNYYINRSSNQLLDIPISDVSGFENVTGNLNASVKNFGWEIVLNSRLLQFNGFKWTSGINLTLPRNKLVSFPNLEQTSYYAKYRIGESVNISRLFSFAGVSSQTGFYQFLDSQGAITNDPQFGVDDFVIVDRNPKFFAGITNSINYKGFDLSFIFQASRRNIDYNRFGRRPGTFVSFGTGNQGREVLNRWQNAGDYAKIERFTNQISDTHFDARSSSDGVVVDATFLKLRNVALSYQLPTKFLSKVNIEALSVFFQGQNLLTVTNFPAGDPETGASGGVAGLPQLRLLTFGSKITF
ncbi:SusC/RagA family TonB-linked outer membrane protein [Pedobacter deserti]|uniref:SusC/RagA family TonB-linked outer membrane protein n=1 Tax=Pedobacter deserti TaxID=2817382 RepID=UPI00210B71CC|nr:SusC/RagA family TonB-linked outer membrane protein [Pedobacter sp. SYSU D00382]